MDLAISIPTKDAARAVATFPQRTETQTTETEPGVFVNEEVNVSSPKQDAYDELQQVIFEWFKGKIKTDIKKEEDSETDEAAIGTLVKERRDLNVSIITLAEKV